MVDGNKITGKKSQFWLGKESQVIKKNIQVCHSLF